MKPGITIEDYDNESKLTLRIKNIPLAIFYLFVIVLIITFFHYFQNSLESIAPKSLQWLIGGILILITLYFTTKSIYGKAVVKVSKDRTSFYEGVFKIGKRKSLPTEEIRKVYVRRRESKGVSSEGIPVPREVKQHIVIQASSKFKFLHNQISSDQLHQFNEIINLKLEEHTT